MSSPPKNIHEALKNITWVRAEIERTQGTPCPTDEELSASRKAFLALLPSGSDVWVFGYGSLIWNPNFEFAENRKAKLSGYEHSFCIDLPANRGTMEKPGLMLALDVGDACEGVAFRIAQPNVETALESLWLREMLAGVYDPKLVQLETGDGIVPGLAFVAKKDHKLYRQVEHSEAAQIIATAEGSLGTNRDYLFQLMTKLDEHSIKDQAMTDLLQRVKELV
ncbi:MAG: gamma-glutamylcyclotransferase [Pseudomonadota bacterium]